MKKLNQLNLNDSTFTPSNSAISAGDNGQLVAEKTQGQITDINSRYNKITVLSPISGTTSTFNTLQSAFDSIPAATDATNARQTYTVYVPSGTYLENVSVQINNRRINMVCLGTVNIGELSGSSWGAGGTTYNLTIANNGTSTINSIRSAFSVTSMSNNTDKYTTHQAYLNGLRISGNMVLTAAIGISSEFYIEAEVFGTFDTSGYSGGCNVYTKNSRFRSTFGSTACRLQHADNVRFDGLVTSAVQGMIERCQFTAGGLTLISASSDQTFYGLVNTQFAAGTTITVPGNVYMDYISNYYIVTNSVTLAGSGVAKVLQEKSLSNTVVNDTTSFTNLLSSSDTNVQLALNTISSLSMSSTVISYNASTDTPSLASMKTCDTYQVTTAGAITGTVTGATKSSGSYLCIGDLIRKNGSTYYLVSPVITERQDLYLASFASINDIMTYLGARTGSALVNIYLPNSTINETTTILNISHQTLNIALIGFAGTLVNLTTANSQCVVENVTLNNFYVTASNAGQPTLKLKDVKFSDGIGGYNTNVASNSSGIFFIGAVVSLNATGYNGAVSATADIINASAVAGNYAFMGENGFIVAYKINVTSGNLRLGYNCSINVYGGGLATNGGEIDCGNGCQIQCSGPIATAGGNLIGGRNSTLYNSGGLSTTNGSVNMNYNASWYFSTNAINLGTGSWDGGFNCKFYTTAGATITSTGGSFYAGKNAQNYISSAISTIGFDAGLGSINYFNTTINSNNTAFTCGNDSTNYFNGAITYGSGTFNGGSVCRNNFNANLTGSGAIDLGDSTSEFGAITWTCGGGSFFGGTNSSVLFNASSSITTTGSGIVFGFGSNSRFTFKGTSISPNFTYNATNSNGAIVSLNSLSAGTTLPVSTPSAGVPTATIWRTL